MKFLNTLVSLWTWLVILSVAIVGFLLQGILLVVTLPFDWRHRRLAARFYRAMARTCVRLTPLWQFSIHGELPKSGPHKMVVVSNHASHLDSFLICLLPWDMKWFGKASLFNIPFIGWCMRLSGDIPVVRGSRESVERAFARCRKYLKEGMSVLMFPEGTRATSDHLLPFKDGAFRLAIETGSDILPITVAGTQRGLPKRAWRFSPARAYVAVCEPLSTAGFTLDDVDKLKELTRQRMESKLQALRPLTAA